MYGDPNRPIGIDSLDDVEGYSLVSEYWSSCSFIYDPEENKICTVENLKYPLELSC